MLSFKAFLLEDLNAEYRAMLPDIESIGTNLEYIFGDKRRIAQKLEGSLYKLDIQKYLSSYNIDFDKWLGYKEEANKSGTKIGKLLNKQLKELKKNPEINKDDIENITRLLLIPDLEKKTKFESSQISVPLWIIYSRVPVDIARMSDFDKISSCHSPSGDYFKCAMNEAQNNGAVAYLLPEDQYLLIKDNLQEDEIFEDTDIGDLSSTEVIDFVSPIGRIRLRKIIDKDGNEQVVPSLKVYGRNNITVQNAEKFKHNVKIWAQKYFNENFSWDDKNFTLVGGTYEDTGYEIKTMLKTVYESKLSQLGIKPEEIKIIKRGYGYEDIHFPEEEDNSELEEAIEQARDDYKDYLERLITDRFSYVPGFLEDVNVDFEEDSIEFSILTPEIDAEKIGSRSAIDFYHNFNGLDVHFVLVRNREKLNIIFQNLNLFADFEFEDDYRHFEQQEQRVWNAFNRIDSLISKSLPETLYNSLISTDEDIYKDRIETKIYLYNLLVEKNALDDKEEYKIDLDKLTENNIEFLSSYRENLYITNMANFYKVSEYSEIYIKNNKLQHLIRNQVFLKFLYSNYVRFVELFMLKYYKEILSFAETIKMEMDGISRTSLYDFIKENMYIWHLYWSLASHFEGDSPKDGPKTIYLKLPMHVDSSDYVYKLSQYDINDIKIALENHKIIKLLNRFSEMSTFMTYQKVVEITFDVLKDLYYEYNSSSLFES